MPNLAPFCSPARRRWIRSAVLATLGGLAAGASGRRKTLTVYTFGDSVLDCARYNEHGVHPGQLLVRNDDALFPEFRGRDLSSRGPARLEHHARDGATVASLPARLWSNCAAEYNTTKNANSRVMKSA